MRKLVNVPVASVWTTDCSAREGDGEALTATPDIESWIKGMDYARLIDLHDRNLIQTQVLYGEEVIVVEEKNGWSSVLVPSQASRKNSDGYPGWIQSVQLIDQPETWTQHQEFVLVTSHGAKLKHGEEIRKLAYATILPLASKDEESIYVHTPTGIGQLAANDAELFVEENGDGGMIVECGMQFLRLPYLWAGNSSFGYDCSGFVYSICRANGYLIPRDVGEQSEFGRDVKLSELEVGDALFFAYEEGKGELHHVGLYAGDGKLLHSPKTGKCIELIELKGTFYEKELCKARRYVRDAR